MGLDVVAVATNLKITVVTTFPSFIYVSCYDRQSYFGTWK